MLFNVLIIGLVVDIINIPFDKGANILRVHDVKEALECKNLIDRLC